MTALQTHYQRLLTSADPAERAVAAHQLTRLSPRAQPRGPSTRLQWPPEALAAVFASAGNTPVYRADGSFRCGHEPVHGSRSGACLVGWPATGRWWCSSCRQGGDLVRAVQSLEGCRYAVAVARLYERYGRPQEVRRVD